LLDGALFDEAAERAVDQRLIVASACAMNLGSKPFKDVVIDTDGDPGFARAKPHNRAAVTFAEVVFLFSSLVPVIP